MRKVVGVCAARRPATVSWRFAERAEIQQATTIRQVDPLHAGDRVVAVRALVRPAPFGRARLDGRAVGVAPILRVVRIGLQPVAVFVARAAALRIGGVVIEQSLVGD